jgi:hypothetical protein
MAGGVGEVGGDGNRLCVRERKRKREEKEVDAGFKYELVAPI